MRASRAYFQTPFSSFLSISGLANTYLLATGQPWWTSDHTKEKRQTQLCFSIALEKQEVKVRIKNRRLSHPDFTSQLQLPPRPLVFLFIITIILCSKSCTLFLCTKDTLEAGALQGQSFPSNCKKRMLLYRKPQAAIGLLREVNKQRILWPSQHRVRILV